MAHPSGTPPLDGDFDPRYGPQVTTRLDRDTAERLDDLVGGVLGHNRAVILRRALRALLDDVAHCPACGHIAHQDWCERCKQRAEARKVQWGDS